MTAPIDPLRRRLCQALLLAVPLLLAGCLEVTPVGPQTFPPLDYSYLTKLKLNVGEIGVEQDWQPQPLADGEHVEAQAPVPPADALRLMAQQRLVAGGVGGHATFVIDSAALVRRGEQVECDLAVHLDISSADGTRTGYAVARASRTRPVTDDSAGAMRVLLYDLVKATMADMNVEFEYQVRHSLAEWLQSTEPVAPAPGPVEQQNLPAPGVPKS